MRNLPGPLKKISYLHMMGSVEQLPQTATSCRIPGSLRETLYICQLRYKLWLRQAYNYVSPHTISRLPYDSTAKTPIPPDGISDGP